MSIPEYNRLIAMGQESPEWIPIAIVMNPKLRVPCLAAIHLTKAGATLFILTMLGKFIGSARIDYDDAFTEASGYPRIHTELDWSFRGEGWATSLYLSGAYAAELIASYEEMLDIEPLRGDAASRSPGVCSASNVRSASANRWWSIARERKISFVESVLIPKRFPPTPVVFRAPAASSVREHGVSSSTMQDAIATLFSDVHHGSVEVEIEKGTVSVQAVGNYRYEVEIDVLLSNAAEETHTILAVPTELRGFGNKDWSRTVFEDSLPERWTLVSPKALAAIEPRDMMAQSEQGHRFASWWLRFLESQGLPEAELDRWRSGFASGASGALLRSRRAPARPPRAWAQLP